MSYFINCRKPLGTLEACTPNLHKLLSKTTVLRNFRDYLINFPLIIAHIFPLLGIY